MASLESNTGVHELHAASLCPHAATAYAWHIESREKALFAAACRRKRCPTCAATMRRALIARITQAKPTKFVTLTCRHEGSPQERLRQITAANSRLWQWIRTNYGPAEYVRIIEWCNDGYPHLHLLARMPYVPQPKLSAKWAGLTKAVVVDIRKAHGRSTHYVAKYVTKHTRDPKAWTRQTISASRGFWQDEPFSDEFIGFHGKPESIFVTAAQLDEQYAVVRLRRGVYWLWDRQPGDELPEELQNQEPEIPL